MTDREPYLVLRDFRVWFQKRQGFLAALRKSTTDYVRAVDGIDLDIHKGEVYCLVGESGCGKTTTGKGILRLVEPTGGDVFVGLGQEGLTEYEEAKANREEQNLEAFRRSHSLTYHERIVRGPRDYLMNALLAVFAAFAAADVTMFLVLPLRSGGAGGWEVLAYVATGILVGFFATLPVVKLSQRLARALILAGILATFVSHLLVEAGTVLLRGQSVDVGTALAAYGAVWQSNAFMLVLLEYLVVLLVTWYAARLFMDFWRHRQGYEADRMRKLRKTLQIIFQDPYESLNPRHSVYDIVAEPLLVNHLTRSRAETEGRVEQALEDAGLRPPRDFLFRYPHELSGGQRQRVSIAGALVLDPDFLVADEPVSMLDVSIRTEIIELLLELRRRKGLTYLFITHDLSLAWVLADRIGVMYLGKIVEEGPTREVIRNPKHPYTKALVSVVPVPDPDRRHERIILKGERPDPSNIPAGCRFHPRCPVAFERCGWTSDDLLDALQELAAVDANGAKFLTSAKLDGPGTLVFADSSMMAEGWIRSQIAAHSETHRALMGIRSMERSDGSLKILLHPFEEPALIARGPAKVACHLYG